MAKQNEKILGGINNALEEGAGRLKVTAKEVTEKVKAVTEEAGSAVKAVAKTAKKTEKQARPATKKTAAVSKNLRSRVIFQFYGHNVEADEVLKKAEKAAQKVCGDRVVKSLDVYINGHENRAYFVVNGEAKEEYRFDL